MIATVVTDDRRFDLVEVTPERRNRLANLVSSFDDVFALPGGGFTTTTKLVDWAKETKHVVRFTE